METARCPIMVAFDKIRGSGMYSEDAPIATVVGAGAARVSYAIDDVQYYVNRRTIEVARARMQARNALKLFRHYDGMSRLCIHETLLYKISRAPHYTILQIQRLFALVTELCADIAYRAAEAASDAPNAALDLTLPSLSGYIPRLSNDIQDLEAAVRAAIDVLNGTDATALGIPSMRLPRFVLAPIRPYADITEIVRIDTSADPAAETDRLHAIELEIAQRVRETEMLYISIINHIADIFDTVSIGTKN